MSTEGYPAGTTESERRERQEFDGIRSWTMLEIDALSECLGDLKEMEESDE
jgi:hypothetical protein